MRLFIVLSLICYLSGCGVAVGTAKRLAGTAVGIAAAVV